MIITVYHVPLIHTIKDAYEQLTANAQTPLQPMTNFIQHSVLGDAWKRLVVRVMSARNHDFGNALANSFYNQDVCYLSLSVP